MSAWADGMREAARAAVKGIRRAPGSTLAILLTLAAGIGASTAAFSVVDGVLLKPLPYPDPERLVSLRHVAPGAPGSTDGSGGLRMSPSMYFTYAEHNRTFEHVGMWSEGTASVTGLAEPEQVETVYVTAGVLEALAVAPALGRAFAAAEFEPGGPRAVILSHGYWQRRLGGDPAAIGRTITVDSVPAEIVGVMPRGFRVVNAAAELIVPFAFDRNELTLPPFFGFGIGRLQSGATVEEANADIARMLPIWMDSWPYLFDARRVYGEGWRIAPALRPLKQDVIGNVGSVLWVVMGTIGIVLVIACANVANLLLVRANARQRELALRAALGAGVRRIAGTMLGESVTLALLGGAAGLVLAFGALVLLRALEPANLPRLDEIALDARAFGFALLVSVLSGLAFGAPPALKRADGRIGAALRGGGRGASAGRERHRTQNVLVIGQVALALVLLVTSGLMIRTFQALRAVDPGFAAANVQTVRIAIPPSLVPEPERVVRMQHDILDALAAIPGVSSAALANALPLEGAYGAWDAIVAEGQAVGDDPGARVMRTFKLVSPGSFATAGTPLVAGRDLTWNDVHDDRPVVLVSANLARELWGEPAAALGRRIRLGSADTPWREIVGVVGDVREQGLDQPPPTIVYWPPLVKNVFPGGGDMQARAAAFVLRTPLAGSPALLRQIEQAVWSVNPGLPVAAVRTMQEIYDGSLARTSFTLVMLAIAGAVALALGVVGLYGVLSYVVAQRRREIAIRLALGAQRSAVRRRYVRYGLALGIAGVAIGAAAAAAVTRLMTSLLFEVRPLDAATYAVVAAALVCAAAVASYLPARRASAVDPAEALAAE